MASVDLDTSNRDILQFREQSSTSRTVRFFPEYEHDVSVLLNSELPTEEAKLDGTRKKSAVEAGEGRSYLITLERSKDDTHRPASDANTNYSIKELLIARALSEFAEYSDKWGTVKFARPVGAIYESENRGSVFRFEHGIRETGSNSDALSRGFAYFVMIYNGILHKEGIKDFLPAGDQNEDTILVVDFEHCEFVPEDRVNLFVDYAIFNLVRFGDQDSDRLVRGFNELLEMRTDARRPYLMDELGKRCPALTERLHPFLESRGYFNNRLTELGAAFEVMVRVRNRLVKSDTS